MEKVVSGGEPVVDWLWRSTWQGSVLILLVLFVQWIFKKRLSPSWRYSLWLLVLVRLALPVSWESGWSVFNLFRQPVKVAEATVRQEPVRTPAQFPQSETDVRPVSMPEPRVRKIQGMVQNPGAQPRAMDSEMKLASSASSLQDWSLPPLSRVLFILWALGAALLTSRTLWQTLRFACLLRYETRLDDPDLLRVLDQCRDRMGLARGPVLISTNLVESPALYGLWRPTLLLPKAMVADFSPGELRYVFMHELAHVKRFDMAINWVMTILQVVHWFNPLVWFGFGRMRDDRELACDSLALSRMADEESSAYGATIIKLLESLARPVTVPGLVGISEDKAQLKQRIRMIAGFKKPGKWSACAALLLLAVGMTALTDARSQPQSPQVVAQTPIDLGPYYDRQMSDFDQPGAWEAVPRGRQQFGNLVFEIGGIIQLFGTASAAEGKSFRQSVEIPLDGTKSQQFHILSGTAYNAPPGTEIAKVRFLYQDGTRSELPIVYAQHVRDWWRSASETPPRVSDPHSRVIWKGTHPYSQQYGKSLRLYKTTLVNPKPEKALKGIELTSAQAQAAWVILSLTSDTSPPSTMDERAQDLEAENAPLPGEFPFRVVAAGSGTPIQKALVWVHFGNLGDDGLTTEYRTDAEGRCTIRLSDPPPSLLHVYGSGTGFAQEYKAWFSGMQDIKEEQRLPKEYTMALKRAVLVGGRVVDDHGNPLQNAVVQLRLRFSSAEFRTDRDGYWSCDALGEDQARVPVYVTHSDFVLAGKPMDLPMEELKARRSVIVMTPGGRVRGSVRAPDGKPLVKAQVHVVNIASLKGSSASTDENGHYAFDSCFLGKVEILAQGAGCLPERRVISVGLEMDTVDFNLKPATGFRGRVIGPDDKGVPGVRVYASDSQGMSSSQPLLTDNDGRFEWKEAPAGALQLNLSKTGYSQQDVSVQNTAGEGVIRLWGPATSLRVSGQVVDARTGQPITRGKVIPGDFNLTRFPEGGSQTNIYWWPGKAVEIREGRFEITMLERGLSGFSTPPVFILQTESDDYLPMVSPPFPRTDRTAVWNVKLEPGTNLSGVVRSENGEPLADAKLIIPDGGLAVEVKEGQLDPYGPSNTRQVYTDHEGKYSLPRHTGPFEILIAEERGCALVTQDDLLKSSDIVVRPWGDLEVTVRFGDRPTTGTRYELINANEPGKSFSMVRVRGFGTTDSQGVVRFKRVLPGLVSLAQVERGSGGRLIPRLTVDVKPGEVTRARLGTDGRLVIGRLQMPEDPEKKLARSRCNAAIRYRLEMIKRPEDLVTPEQIRAWFAAYPKTEAGRERGRKQEALFPVQVEEDGTFRAEGVPAGEFTITVAFLDEEQNSYEPAQVLGRARQSFTMPVTAREPAEPLSIGFLKVSFRKQLLVGSEAPEVTARGLRGNLIKLSQFRGKYVVLDYWQHGRGDVDVLLSLQRTLVEQEPFSQGRAVLLSVCPCQTRKQLEDFVAKHSPPGILAYLDPADDLEIMNLCDDWGVRSGYFVIDPAGKLVAGNVKPEAVKEVFTAKGTSSQ